MPVENILIAITINIVFDYKPSNGKLVAAKKETTEPRVPLS
jgi:hypothetical protein